MIIKKIISNLFENNYIYIYEIILNAVALIWYTFINIKQNG